MRHKCFICVQVHNVVLVFNRPERRGFFLGCARAEHAQRLVGMTRKNDVIKCLRFNSLFTVRISHGELNDNFITISTARDGVDERASAHVLELAFDGVDVLL